MGWDYSDLSSLAKQNGGPTQLLSKHAAYHFEKGATSKKPVIAAASLISLCIGIGGTRVYLNWKNKKNKAAVTDTEIYKIEKELISGMEQAGQGESLKEANQEEVIQIQPPEEENSNEDLRD